MMIKMKVKRNKFNRRKKIQQKIYLNLINDTSICRLRNKATNLDKMKPSVKFLRLLRWTNLKNNFNHSILLFEVRLNGNQSDELLSH